MELRNKINTLIGGGSGQSFQHALTELIEDFKGNGLKT